MGKPDFLLLAFTIVGIFSSIGVIIILYPKSTNVIFIAGRFVFKKAVSLERKSCC